MHVIDRRCFVVGSGLIVFSSSSSALSQTQVLKRKLSVASVSWIDGSALPELSLLDGLKAFNQATWPLKVMVGLVGTSNNAPASPLPSDFQSRNDYRAFTAFDLSTSGIMDRSVIDSGYTPPINKDKLPVYVRPFVPDDSQYYAGEHSPISLIRNGALSPASTIRKPDGYEIIASALIKFRAGKHTDQTGIEKAGSAYHVPWVWSEHALFRKGNDLRLIASGSRFPSHAWYVDGKKVLEMSQSAVTATPTEIAFTKGAPATVAQLPASDDKSPGRIDTHPFTLPANDRGPLVYDFSLA